MPNQNDFKYALLKALNKKDGNSEPQLIYPLIEQILGLSRLNHPEMYETDDYGDVKWQNRTRFARNDLKDIGVLDCPERGRWMLTPKGYRLLKKADEVLTRIKKEFQNEKDRDELSNIFLSRLFRKE